MTEAHEKTVSARSRFKGWAAREFGYKPFLILLGAGLLIRAAVQVMYFPAWIQANDIVRFARIEPTSIFGDYWMPAGYALFVRGLRAITTELWITIAIQHLIGLGVGVILFMTLRRLGARPWLACIPAGFAFLSGDLLWTEHQLMAENFVTFFLVAGFGCAVKGLIPRVDKRWLAAASALIMYAGLSRNVGLAALPVFLLTVGFWVPGPVDRWVKVMATALVPAVIVFGLYFAAFKISDGEYLGLTNMSGWNLYARVAPFADCSKFTPPKGTARLCETTPTADREGSLGYEWDPNSRGRSVFPMEPATAGEVGEFARAAILHQPLSYLREVFVEALRYVDPAVEGSRPYSGIPANIQSFGLNDPANREVLEGYLAEGYSGTHVRVLGKQVLSTYQDLFRIGGLVIAVLALFTVLGAFVARGAFRLGIFLFGGTAFVLYLVPVAALAYEFRYGVQPQLFLVVSGTLGCAAAFSRWISRSRSVVDQPEVSGREGTPTTV